MNTRKRYQDNKTDEEIPGIVDDMPGPEDCQAGEDIFDFLNIQSRTRRVKKDRK